MVLGARDVDRRRAQRSIDTLKSTDTVVVAQRRWKLGGVGLGVLAVGIVAITAGTRAALGLGETETHWVTLVVAGGAMALLGAAGVVAVVLRWVRPQPVVVTTEGLQIGRADVIPWSTVTGIEAAHAYHLGSTIASFVVVERWADGERTSVSLPSGLALGPRALLVLLRDAWR